MGVEVESFEFLLSPGDREIGERLEMVGRRMRR